MKRMNLKKAISLLTFLLVMVIGTTAVAQDATSINKLKEEIKSIRADYSAKESRYEPMSAANTDLELKITLMNLTVERLNQTSSSSAAIEKVFAQFEAMEPSAQRTKVLVIKQEIIALID